MSYNSIGNAEISLLAKAFWPELRWLDVGRCNLTTDAVRLIRKADWPKMLSIDF